jgi:hypothetical protein
MDNVKTIIVFMSREVLCSNSCWDTGCRDRFSGFSPRPSTHIEVVGQLRFLADPFKFLCHSTLLLKTQRTIVIYKRLFIFEKLIVLYVIHQNFLPFLKPP